ncbi:MAG: hypothetical protein R3E97_19895 [Candidatus Eisenbacteria bacterium]
MARVILAVWVVLLLTATSALADEAFDTRALDRPAFEREWLAVLTGGVAVLNVGLAGAGRNSPLAGAAALGSGLVLAFADDGRFSDVLGSLGVLAGASTLLAFAAEDATRELDVVGGSGTVAGDRRTVLAVRYRW